MTLTDKAEAFKALHRPGDPLRLLNAWDAGSARLFAADGAPAIATTSAGLANALGRADGEDAMTRDEVIEATARIARAVDIPVSADVQGGFGDSPDAVGETIRLVLGAGAIGVNLEDSMPADKGVLRSLDDHAARVAAARAAADAAGVPLFVNARADVYLRAVGEPHTRFDHTVQRLKAYVGAGADGVFAPGLTDLATIKDLVEALAPAPLNLLAAPQLPRCAELATAGVARVSLGSGASSAAFGAARRVANEMLERGTWSELHLRLPYDEAQRIFGE